MNSEKRKWETKMKLCNPYHSIGSVALVLLVVLSAFCDLGFCKDDGLIRMKPVVVGGVRDVEGMRNSAEIESVGRFAVDEHNKKEVFLEVFLNFLHFFFFFVSFLIRIFVSLVCSLLL